MKTTFTKIALSASIAVALVSPNAQAQEPIWDGNTVVLQSEKLNDNVFAVYPTNAAELGKKGGAAATSGGFIVGDKGVLMIETMLNQRLNKQAQDLIAAQTKKPIIYAVNTSAHGDHSYGNMYLPKGVKIIQHANTSAYIGAHFKADTDFMLQNFGKGRGIEQIKPTPADILVGTNSTVTIDLGNKKVDIMDFGFAQTGGDLMVWDAADKVMWTGNAIITNKPALPWLLDGHLIETLETFKKIYAFLPADARIVPGHGVVMGREDIKWHIDYLTTIKTQVADAIAQGLTLEQTVEKVKMPEYRGYVLFDWVHPKLNVPAAYKDLTKPAVK